MRKLRLVCIAILFFVPTFSRAQNSAKRTIAIDDIYRMEKVGSPQVSPDGKWVAYTVTTIDKDAEQAAKRRCGW